LFGPAFPWNNRNYWKSSYLRAFPDAAVDTVVEYANKSQSALSVIVIEYYGGAVSRVAADATAFAHRDANFNLLILGQWQEAAEDALHVQWARDCWQALTPWTSNAVEMNTLSAGEDPQVVRASYGSNYPRLAALKARLDPQNLFRMNQNIPPAP
jgi:FAD/FMN-containing dehydrogenase